MVAYFVPCFWCKILKNKREALSTGSEQLHCKTVFSRVYPLVKNFSTAAFGHSLKKSTLQLPKLSGFFYSKYYLDSIIISSYGVQSSSLESDVTPDL